MMYKLATYLNIGRVNYIQHTYSIRIIMVTKKRRDTVDRKIGTIKRKHSQVPQIKSI